MISYETLAIAVGAEVGFLKSEAAIREKIIATPPAVLAQIEEDETNEGKSRLLQIAGNVGVISVKGGLTNENSYWNQYFDLISYDEVRQAAMDAVEAGVGSVLFDMDTPGGRVSGMADCANFISAMNIPTIAFTSGSMCSAGYFLGCQASEVYADSFAEVGSVGVLIKFYDQSKYLSDLGIKPIRFRSGKLKAVGDGDFSLSAKEKAYIQDKVANLAGKFFQVVSDARGLTLPMMKKAEIITGRTFIGDEAVKVQLVDEQKTFDECMVRAYKLAEKVVDKRNTAGLSY